MTPLDKFRDRPCTSLFLKLLKDKLVYRYIKGRKLVLWFGQAVINYEVKQHNSNLKLGYFITRVLILTMPCTN
jgi:hypothetical protein